MTNMPFKVLLCGGSGMLGQELLHSIPDGIDVWAPSSSEFDIRDRNVVLQKAALHQPGLIINAAAYTNVDSAEINQDLAFAINRNGPENLGMYAAKASIPVFHISTDYVFDGTKKTPYTEDDEPNPINVYGKSKLAGERALQRVCYQSLILRTSWLFSVYGKNFVKTIYTAIQEGKELKVVDDQYGCPTSAASLAEVLWKLVRMYQKDRVLTWEVLNFSNFPPCTWYGFSQALVNNMKNKKIQILPLSSNDYVSTAKRPLWSVLNTSRINKKYKFKNLKWINYIDNQF
jgi:dTDP-4-dehydrorhamnose reductase